VDIHRKEKERMRSKIRWLALTLAVGGLLTLGVPSSADHATRSDVRNIEALTESPNTDTLANSDLAFWGDLAFQGHWEGFRVLNISDPANPTQIVDYTHCNNDGAGLGGGQGDIIVWENLLVRGWNSNATATAYCGTDANNDPIPISRTGFEGIHIFDISNPASPKLVGEVDIDTDAAGKPAGIAEGCGSHTLTAVPDPANNTLYIYVGGSGNSATTGNCGGMDLVKVPLNNPAAADWYGRAEAIPAGAERGRSCHDITVFMINKRRAVCSGTWIDTDPDPDVASHGFAYFSMDAADGGSLENPVLLYQRDVPGTRTVGHTSAFSWDGKILGWSHEPGGGVEAACEITDPVIDRQMFFFAAETGSLKGTFTIPTQTADESCASIHIMQSIPTTNGRDVYASGTYMANTYIIDYTDPTNPSAIGWSDGPADIAPAPPGLILGGAWTTYWYNGYLYESNIKKGLFVSRSTSPEAQTPVELEFLNPQTMMPLPEPGVLCKGKEATLVGTDGADNIVGTSGRDVIAALGGNDKVNAKGGKDLVCAGGGKDKVSGKGGNDRLFGEGGNDTLNGGAGKKDRCNGGAGKDKAIKCEREQSIEK
jgi:hypothetical protein